MQFIGNSASDHPRGGAIVVKNAKAFSQIHKSWVIQELQYVFFLSNIKYTGKSIFNQFKRG